MPRFCMGDTEATLHPIRTVLSLDCHQYRLVVPNCSGGGGRAPGGGDKTFSVRALYGSLCPVHIHSGREFQYSYTCTVCTCSKAYTATTLNSSTYMYSYSEGAHSRQLINFSSLPCPTIHQSKALGLSIPTVYGTSSAELIQHQSSV